MLGLRNGLESQTDGIKDSVRNFAQVASTLKGLLSGDVDFREGLSNVLGSLGGTFVDKGISGAFGAFGIPGFANGTNFAPGGLALVGERGPELVNLPRGAKVTPNDRIGGGAMDVRVYGDQGGNWRAAVERISGNVSAQVTQAGMAQVRRDVPAIVQNNQRRAVTRDGFGQHRRQKLQASRTST